MLRILAVVVLMISFGARAGTDLPSAPARQVFDRWLAAHNAGERELLAAFNAAYGVTTDVEDDLEFRESFGRLQLAEVRAETPTGITVVLVSEWGRALLATIGIEQAKVLRLSGMRFEGVPMPEAFRPRPMPMDALVEEARRRLDALAAEDRLSGSFLLAHAGRPLFAWHGGLADREASVPVSAETRFRFASLGKMFTAVAVLQLVEAGRLELDAPLSTYLPDYPNRAVADAVTLRHLLSHTGGTGEVFDARFSAISSTLRTHRDYWPVYAPAPLAFAPGSDDGYSNYGYILLGSVIEAVSGQSYYDYVAHHIFDPAGMGATGAEPESVEVPGRAHAYTRVDGRWVRETASLPWRGTAAGGGYTTAGDLMRFAAALADGRLLSEASLRMATQPQNTKGWYGFGFLVGGDGAQRQYGHEGGAPGANAVLNVRPATGHVVIGLSNQDPATMEQTVNFITQRLP
ncbi:serine hydrolase domain-containing protein [Xanthomonas sp. XNM01]|uniref:serine hydrolase domain-containing protein n=1 Tax=Xanthomonas sp. XNM01 TaxID=2769289 RepID=UPI001CE1B043|nr:serine hydrolase domain-containing protein [Xanthomonas sp. XNM01]